ncbi:MAG TPA: DNA gyrase inhibitor YacG [Pyrinomonadaceae bacterium]|nr:DNA gyrase inhibitor YacG [Pyrinomonadaceae bacterium]
MKCPTCHQPTTYQNNPFRPFCSERCKLIDFGAWVNEEYAVPSDEPAPSLEETDKNSEPSDTGQSRARQ